MSRSAWLAMVLATLPAVADEPGVHAKPGPAPDLELLEYLGTWDGDEEWLHTKELLPAPSREASSDHANGGRDRGKREGVRATSEQ
jgi:hypothetical protein